MFKYKDYNCPIVKKGETVKAIDINEGFEYDKIVITGRVLCMRNSEVLIDLGKIHNRVGCIDGWIAEKWEEEQYGCKIGNYYWWFDTWKLGKVRKIEIE